MATRESLETVFGWKRTLTFILGLLGGSIGLSMSFYLVADQSSGFPNVQPEVVTVLSLIALAGAGLAFLKPQVAGILLFYAGMGGFIAFGGIGWFIPGVVLITASIFAWSAGRAPAA